MVTTKMTRGGSDRLGGRKEEGGEAQGRVAQCPVSSFSVFSFSIYLHHSCLSVAVITSTGLHAKRRSRYHSLRVQPSSLQPSSAFALSPLSAETLAPAAFFFGRTCRPHLSSSPVGRNPCSGGG